MTQTLCSFDAEQHEIWKELIVACRGNIKMHTNWNEELQCYIPYQIVLITRFGSFCIYTDGDGMVIDKLEES